MVKKIHLPLAVDPKVLAGRELLPPSRQGSSTFTIVKGIPGRRPTDVDILAGAHFFKSLPLEILTLAV